MGEPIRFNEFDDDQLWFLVHCFFIADFIRPLKATGSMRIGKTVCLLLQHFYQVDIVDDLQVPGVRLNRQAVGVEADGHVELERGSGC